MATLSHWLQSLADFLVFTVLGMPEGPWYTETVHYFIIGFTQITLLLIIVSYLMGAITSYISLEKIGSSLEKSKRRGVGNIFAALFGAITPFCSCTSVPLFVGMMQSRVPLGIALSFLITSPLVNEIAVAIFWASFGWKVTVIYILSGVLLGVIGGLLLDVLGFDQYVADWVQKLAYKETATDENNITIGHRISAIHKEAASTVVNLIPYVLIGMVVGAFIHGYVPASLFEQYISDNSLFAVPTAVVIGIPLYIDAVSVLPIIVSLVGKGVPLGTAIAFMMGTIGLSLPEGLLLKKVMKKELIIGFFTTIGIGMILLGYFFNLVL